MQNMQKIFKLMHKKYETNAGKFKHTYIEKNAENFKLMDKKFKTNAEKFKHMQKKLKNAEKFCKFKVQNLKAT